MAGLRTTSSAGLVWFRGQGRADWKLTPGLAREDKLDAELTIIKRFKQSAAPYLTYRPHAGLEGEWEWIFLMQHHRAPTRLLDWTESPIVALYFAVQEDKHDDTAAAVWCIDPIALNKMAGHNRGFELDILAFGIDKSLDEYLPEKVNARVAKALPVAAIGPRNSPRMAAQAGTFTVIHAEAIAIEEVGDYSHVWRFVIPSDAKAQLREELKLIGISEHSLFPDLDRVAKLAGSLV